MSSSLDSVKILNRLKDLYDFKTDKQLSAFLDIPYSTLTGWKTTKVNWDVIHEKCPNLSWDYLRTGIGDPYLNAKEHSEEKTDSDSKLAINNLGTFQLTEDEKRQMLLRLLRDPYTGLEKPTNDQKISILYVDDEVHNLNAFKANFRQKYRIYIANSGKDALQQLEDYEIDIIITDQRMPEMTGIEFLEAAMKIKSEPMRILMTGYSDIEVVTNAINKGKIFYYLDKPWKNEEIEEIIAVAFGVYTERKRSKIKTKELEDLNFQYEILLRQKLLS